MVIADFNILCLKQKYKKIYDSSVLGIETYKSNKVSKIYGERWSILSSFEGYVYSLYPIDEKQKYDYSHGLFDLKIEGDLKYIVLSGIEIRKFVEIIDFYLKCSPINKICVLIRLDWSNDNTIIGTVTKNDFIYKLTNQKLLFNTAYIISI